MKHKLHITIPQPCHESWEAMDATKQGAFCQSCRKEVVDFSMMTDHEVIEYLSKSKLSCGRFRRDQVGRAITTPVVDNGFLRWRGLLLGLLPMLAFKQSVASVPVKALTDQSPIAKKPVGNTIHLEMPKKVFVCGKVIDNSGAVIQGASIQVILPSKGFDGNGAVSDSDGYFELHLEAHEFADGLPHLKVENDRDMVTVSLKNDSIQNFTVVLHRLLASDMVVGMSMSYQTVFYDVRKPKDLLKKFVRMIRESSETEHGQICVYGNISNYEKPLANTSIRVVDSTGTFYGNGAVTDAAGDYTIYLDKADHKNKKYHLEIIRDGYYTRMVEIGTSHMQQRYLRLRPISTKYAPGHAIAYKESTLMQWSLLRIRYWFRKRFGKH